MNEQLAELTPWHRLCFQGLWCCADRNGRLRDRPKRLKAEVFPYDDLNIDLLLWDLARAGFIRRYVSASQPLIDIPSWEKHQHPRPDEAASELAAYVDGADRTTSVLDVSTCPAASPIVTDPSLSSDESVAPARSGSGVLGLGSGVLGNGVRAADAASSPEATSRSARAQDLIDLWNATTKPPIPRCRELTEDRRRKIRARLAKRPSFADWREVFEGVQAGAFYRGENDRGWVADFDWIIKNETAAARVLERVRTAHPGQRDAWVCAHEPPCGATADWPEATAFRCHQRTQLEAARKARAS